MSPPTRSTRTLATPFLVLTVLVTSAVLAMTPRPVQAQAACTISWTSAVSGLWTDSSKWNTATIPGSTDDVCIIVDGTYTVTVHGTPSVKSVTVGAAGNTGTQTLWVQGSNVGGAVNLTAANGFSNFGAIRIESIDAPHISELTVTTGTLSNLGTIDVDIGAAGARKITANIDNSGALNINQPLTLNKIGGTFTNSGTTTIATGESLASAAANQVWTQDGGALVANGTLTLGASTFNQNGGALNVASTFSILSGVFNSTGGEISGTLTLDDSSLTFGTTTATGTPTFIMQGSAATLSGNVPVGSTVWVQGSNVGGAVNLTAANGFSNFGAIRIESIDAPHISELTVTTGTLSNLGTIDVNIGAAGARKITANIDNSGALNINQPLTLNKIGGTFTNSGTTTVAAGKSLTAAAANQVWNQDGGALVANGTFTLGASTFNQNGGALNVASTFSMVTGVFNSTGGEISGTLTLDDSSLTFGTTTATGTPTFIMQGPAATLSGNVPVGSTVWVQGSNVGGAVNLTAANGFSNFGAIRIESIDSTHVSELTVTTGMLSNLGTIDVNIGSAGVRKITANIDNSGALNINESLTLPKGGGTFTNSGTTTIATGESLASAAANQVWSQDGGAMVADGPLTLGASTFNQNGGTLNLASTFSMVGGVFNSNGGEVSGTLTLDDSSLTFGTTTATGTPTFIMQGPVPTLSGNVPVGSTVWVQGSNIGGAANLTAADGFSNFGAIRIESIDAPHVSELTVTTGTLSNLGTIDVNLGAGGPRKITANIDNNGGLNVNLSISLPKAGGTFTNSGTTTVASGSTLTFSGSSFNNAPGGTIQGGGIISVPSATFVNAGSVGPGSSPGALTITGSYTQTASGALDVEIGGLASGTQFDVLNVTGAATLDGALNLSVVGGFAPGDTESFRILTFASRSGDFATKNGLSLGAGRFFDPVFDATGLTLGVTSVPSADLVVTKTGSSDQVAQGFEVSYAITVANNGPEATTGVVVTDNLPGGFVFVSATSTQGTCDEVGGTVTCSLGGLGINATSTITIVALASQLGSFVNVANVTSTKFDPVETNNTASEGTAVLTVSQIPGSTMPGLVLLTLGLGGAYYFARRRNRQGHRPARMADD